MRHSEDYAAVIGSPRWRSLRLAVIRLQDGLCGDCGDDAPLDLHHFHYRTLGREGPDDVIALCRRCHQKADRRRRIETAVDRYAP